MSNIPPQETTPDVDHGAGSRSARIQRLLGRQVAASEAALDTSDPYLDLYGDSPDQLADAWDAYHGLQRTLLEDPEFDSAFQDVCQTNNTSMIIGGSRSGRGARLVAADKPDLIELFSISGRAQSVAGGFKHARAFATYGRPDNEGALEAHRRHMPYAKSAMRLSDLTNQLFGFTPEGFKPTKAHIEVGQRLSDLRENSEDIGKDISTRSTRVLEATDKILSEYGFEGANWLIDLVINSAGEGHPIRSMQMIADQLIAEHRFTNEHSRIARAIRVITNRAEHGSLAGQFAESLLQDHGDDLHQFYKQVMQVNDREFIDRVAANFGNFSPTMQRNYQAFVTEKLSEIRRKIERAVSDSRTDYGLVNVEAGLALGQRLYKKFWGIPAPIARHGSQGAKSQTGRVNEAVRARKAATKMLGSVTTQEACFEPREVVVGARGENGITISDRSIEDQVAQWLGGHKADDSHVRFFKSIINDLAASKRFKSGVQILKSATARFTNDIKARPVFSVNPKNYSTSEKMPRAIKGGRVVFTLSPDNELVLLGVFTDHATYEAGIRKLKD